MNYVYDIFLNYNKYFFDFFEWNNNDYFVHVKKIPIFRLNDYDYFNLKNNLVNIDISFLQLIYKKTDLFTNSSDNSVFYSCLISNSFEVIGLKFNKKGNIIEKSSLVIDEELEILNYVNRMKKYNIKYKLVCKRDCNIFYTRNEFSLRRKILILLKDVEKNKNYDLVDYLYFECFNKHVDNFSDKIFALKKSLFNNLNSIFDVFNNYFKIKELKRKKVFNYD